MTKSSKEKDRPSKARRDRLRAAERKPNQTISNLVPIERYYDVATKILSEFNKAVKTHRLDDAFIYGRRFLTFSMQSLPKHDYYKNREILRLENQNHMYKVMDELEKTVDLMDLEELEKMEIKRREEEAMRVIKEREALMKKEEEDRAATEELMKRLSMLDQIPRGTTGDSKKSQEVQNQQQQQQQQQQNDTPIILEDLPPPIPFNAEIAKDPLPPSYDQLPPSYDHVALSRPGSEYRLKTETSYQEDSTRSLQVGKQISTIGDTLPIYMDNKDRSWSAVPLPSCPSDEIKVSESQKHQLSPPPTPKLSLINIRTACTMEYSDLLSTQKVQIFTLSTYQGRINRPGLDSTNGCAVISPLVAAHHLSLEGSGIADSAIERIIDTVAPPILNRVRKKLGLGPLALIIPSDVHDFLVDENILKQDKFVGVCGGNLLDFEHVEKFLDMMEKGSVDVGEGNKDKEKTAIENMSSLKTSQKVAATLFFHEHVVSIVKVVRSHGESWYDLVDSLPRRQKNGNFGATRTRCKDRDSLRTVLFWYASNKFSQTDEQYINSNEWDDTMGDLDPRVFQAFAWRE